MKFLGKKNSESDSAIWLSNSDLMAGLMIIFLQLTIQNVLKFNNSPFIVTRIRLNTQFLYQIQVLR